MSRRDGITCARASSEKGGVVFDGGKRVERDRMNCRKRLGREQGANPLGRQRPDRYEVASAVTGGYVAAGAKCSGTAWVYVDMMQRHNPSVPAGEFIDGLSKRADAGRIGVFSGSNWSTARSAEARAYARGDDPITSTTTSRTH